MNEAVVKHIQSLPVVDMHDIANVGNMLAQTDLFGTRNPSDGFAIACMCHQEGISFMEFMRSYHFIKGKISKRADKIQADFQAMGGEIEIAQRDADGAVVKLTFGKTKYTSRCVWSEIKDEPFAKTQNYATPRKRMQMMWARAISDGVRTVCPQAVAGVYTPEEIEAFDEERHEPVKIDAAEAAKRVDAAAATTTATAFSKTEQPAAKDNAKPTRAAADAEPTPFEMIDTPATATAPIDVSVCPVPGPMFGKPWASMPLEHLKAAETLTNAEMTPGHIEAIRKCMWEITSKGAK